MSSNKSYGLYSCPIRLLKCSRQILGEPLAIIFNTSIESGIFPTKLKIAKVIPIFKAGDATAPSNCRPISLLSIFNKIFEKLIYKRLNSYLISKEIISESQYGFREKHSTEHAVLDIISKIQANMDKKLFSCGVFIDLSKAFDTVNHDILLDKLHHYGIRGILNKWFASYLKRRFQTTEIKNCISEKQETLCGVPQGSVLGPLLFLNYINDICNSSNILKFYIFADDTNLLHADNNLKNLEKTFNKELAKVSSWLIANKLTLNISKSNFVIFRPYQKKITYQPTLKLFDNNSQRLVNLECKTYVKYLGVLIDQHLSWKHHIDHIALRISKTAGIIARLRHFVPFSILSNLYRSLILPYLSYGVVAWGRAAKYLINKLLLLQKRALRLMYFTDKQQHAIPLFLKSNFLPIQMIYFEKTASLMYDISTNEAPSLIQQLFTKAGNVHGYGTRSATSGNYYVKSSRLEIQKNSFSRSGTFVWNSLPLKLRHVNKRRFKKELRVSLFNILESENKYIGVSELITRLPDVKFTV